MHLSTLSRPFALSIVITLSSTSLLMQTAFAQVPQTDAGVVTPNTRMPSFTNDRGIEQENARPSIQVDTPDVPTVVMDRDEFMVNRIDIEGNSVIPTETLRPIVAGLEGREVTMNDLAKAVGKINTEYRERGYLTSIAFVPAQDFSTGVVKINVLEGIVGEQEISGNKYIKAHVVENAIEQEPGQPLNIPQLEKELVRMNRTQPFHVKATLSPGARTGETDIHYDITEQQPWQISLTTDNLGRPTIGTYRWGAEVANRNLTGVGDRLSARYIGAAGTTVAMASYNRPINRYGTEIGASFGFTHVDVDLDIDDQIPITGNAYNYGLSVAQPLDKDRTFVLDAGFNARRISSFFDHEKTNQDDIRSLVTGLNFNKYDRWGRTIARAQMSIAPEWMGANTSFFKTETFLTRLFRLPHNQFIILRAASQWTPNDLPVAEQFQLGGEYSVRGYSEGLLLGDRGYNVSAEYRFPLPFMRKVSPWVADRVQGAAFVDYGQAFLDSKSRNFVAGISNRPGQKSLLGAGVGLRAHLSDRLQGFVDFGFGLLDRGDVEPNAQPTVRVNFGIRSDLLSNDYDRRSDVVTPIKQEAPRVRSVGLLAPQEFETPTIGDPTLEPTDLRVKMNAVY